MSRHATLVAITDTDSLVITDGGDHITFPAGSARCPLVPIGTRGVLRDGPIIPYRGDDRPLANVFDEVSAERASDLGTLPVFVPDTEAVTLTDGTSITLTPVEKSSNITGVAYSPPRRVLTVRFKADSVYEYSEVPPEVWRDLCRAESVGKFLCKHIKGVYEYRKVA